ncbi:MAG TPA: NAD kinase [Phaeodactylibacter sp.]|nr:NAD kinase [Phaeodactylibacter sp.]
MLIAVYSKEFKSEDLPYLEQLMEAASEHGIDLVFYAGWVEELRAYLKGNGQDTGIVIRALSAPVFSTHADLRSGRYDFLMTLGGDGTILSTLTLVRDSGIPVVGINLGRMGFLASIEKRYIARAVRQLVEGRYRLEERSLIELDGPVGLFGDFPYALNDFTMLKLATASMITVHAYLDGGFLNTYWADGLIVATPTGSTGYSLSCGGPIVFPDTGNFVVTPVAPHNLSVRPIVISDQSELRFEFAGRSREYLCTLDSRNATVDASCSLRVRKAPFSIRLLRPEGSSFPDTLRSKLIWGQDSRN